MLELLFTQSSEATEHYAFMSCGAVSLWLCMYKMSLCLGQDWLMEEHSGTWLSFSKEWASFSSSFREWMCLRQETSCSCWFTRRSRASWCASMYSLKVVYIQNKENGSTTEGQCDCKYVSSAMHLYTLSTKAEQWKLTANNIACFPYAYSTNVTARLHRLLATTHHAQVHLSGKCWC